MSRRIFVLFLLLFSVNFWYMKPFGKYLDGNLGLFFSFAFIIFGGIYYYLKGHKPLLLVKEGYCLPLLWILAAVLLSFLPAYKNYGQGLLTSILASKSMILYLAVPALFISRPSFKDIEWALYVFSVLYLFVTIVDSYFGLPIIEKIEGNNYVSTRDYVFEGDFVHTLEGIHYVGMAFIFSLYRLKNHFSSVFIVIVFFLLGEIFLVQNRSTLFPCLVFLLYSLCTIRHRKYKVIIRTSVLLMTVLFVILTFQHWLDLLEETVSELGNEGYNRNLAMVYFLGEACPGRLEYFIGNGFLSAKSTPVMQEMMELGVFNSDVGFVGFWNQYGLIPVFVFGFIIVRIIMSRRFSFITKCNAWFIVACSLTTAYFAQDCKILWACLFIYMYSVEDFFSDWKRKSRNSIPDK